MSWNYFRHDELYSVFGLDGSRWQVNPTSPNVDWDLLTSRISFIYWRALLAKEYDIVWDYVYQNLKNYPDLPKAWYQLLLVRASGSSLKAQFEALKRLVDDYGMPDMGLVLDVETNPDNLNKTDFGNQLAKYLAWCFGEFGEDKISIYTRTSWWDQTLAHYNTGYPKKTKLMVARYIERIPTPVDQYYGLPYDWDIINHPVYGSSNWMIWQNSADGNGLGPAFGVQSKSIDLNRFYGDKEDFKKIYGVYPQEIDNPLVGDETDPPPPPPPDDIKEIVPIFRGKVTAYALNTRSKPGGVDLGEVIKDSTMPFTQETDDWAKAEFWVHKDWIQKA